LLHRSEPLDYVIVQPLRGALDVDVAVVLPLDVLVQVPPVREPGGAGILLPGVDDALRLTDVAADTDDPAVAREEGFLKSPLLVNFDNLEDCMECNSKE
jgi:hypothetical protein